MSEIGCFWLGIIIGGAGLELLRQWITGEMLQRCAICGIDHHAD